jgi:hypothetical protein
VPEIRRKIKINIKVLSCMTTRLQYCQYYNKVSHIFKAKSCIKEKKYKKNYVASTYLGVGYLFVIMSKVINALLRADFSTPTNI